jgi:putative toxin-antitoxin system antitoxin component (TIGR02293 family)
MSVAQNNEQITSHQVAQHEPIVKVVNGKLKRWFGWSIHNELDYSQLASKGVDPQTVAKLREHGFQRTDLNWLIPARTLSHRIRNREKLTREESAKVIRVARLTAQAEAIFGDPDKAHRWLGKPKKQLNGSTPKEAMQDEFGAALVVQMLRKIDSGYF